MPCPFLGVGPRRVPGFGNDGLSSRIDLVLAEIVDRARRSEPVAKLFAQTPVLVSSAREAQTMLRKFIEGFPDWPLTAGRVLAWIIGQNEGGDNGVEVARKLSIGHAFAGGGEGDLDVAVPLHEPAIRGPLHWEGGD